MAEFRMARFGEFLTERKEYFTIDDMARYKRARVHLHWKGIVLRDEINGNEIKTKKQQAARIGELLVAEIDAKVGGIGIVPAELDGAIVSSHYFLFKINEKICSREWLDWYVRSGWLEDQVNAQGSTNYAAIRPSHVLEYEIPLPPLTEQRRIVARLEALSARIEAARRLRQEAGEEAKALLESAVGKVFSDINGVNTQPLKNLTTKIGSGSTPKGGRETYLDEGIPFIRSMNVRMRYFQLDDIAYIDETTHESMSGTKLKTNDVLLNITGASIGRVACMPEYLGEANVNQHVAIIRPVEALDHKFLMYWLSQPEIQKYINDEQKGATRQGFTKYQIENLNVPVPPLDEQRRIVAHLDAVQAKVDELRRLQSETREKLSALIPSVLDRAFKGEL